MKSKILLFLIILCFHTLAKANDKLKTIGNNSPVISNTSGDVSITYKSLGISIKAHEELLRKEIAKVEEEIKRIGSKKTKELVNKLSALRSELDKVIDEKNSLAKIVYEYRTKFASLKSNKPEVGKFSEQFKTDIELVELSEDSRNKLSKEIKESSDIDRMLALLKILIADTASMDDKERQYWYDIMGTMNFNQKYRLFNILSIERRKLADLERKYADEIKKLNAKHLKEWYKLQVKDLEKKGRIKELKLVNIKRHTLLDHDISSLRLAEQKTKELIALHPTYLDAYIYLLELLSKYKEDRDYDAMVIMEEAKQYFKGNSFFNKEIGYIYSRLGDEDKAYKHLKSAALDIDDDSKLHSYFAWLALKNNEAALAKVVVENSYDKKKGDSNFVRQYSAILNALGDNEKSIKVLVDYIDNNEPSSSIFNSLAWHYYLQKDYKSSYAYFEKSYRVNKYNYPSMVMASLAMLESNGELSKTIEIMENAFAVFNQKPNKDRHENGEINLALSVMHSELGNIDKVIQYSVDGVKDTYGCSVNYMKKLNWHENAIALLTKNRLKIGCP